MDDSAWEAQWSARKTALESVLGSADEVVGHAVVPFEMGVEVGGSADVLYFRKYLDGVVSVTAELIGRDDQVQNDMGNFELMVCHRDDEEWGPNLISRLAYLTLEKRLNGGETMDVRSASPRGSAIEALLFSEFARFTVRGRRCGLLLCVGLTRDELKACQRGRRAQLDRALRVADVYPFTDLFRSSVL